MIVTDHHEQESSLPDALVINPKNWMQYLKHLAGVGGSEGMHCVFDELSPSFKIFHLIADAESGYMLSVIRDVLCG